MPPKPRTRIPNLPKYVSESNGRIVYRPRIPKEWQHLIATDKSGFLRPPVRLGKPGDPEAYILNGYLAAKASLEARIGSVKHTLRWVIDEYKKSKSFKALAIESQRQAEVLSRILDHPVSIDGKDSTLGDLQITHISKPVVRRLAEKRLDDYQAKGRKGTVQVNREITFLSSATKWAMNYLDNLGLIENPFRIIKFKEEPNRRYVTDEEYEIQYKQAARIAEYLPVIFEITYLVASRGIETLDIKLTDIDPDRNTGGIYVHRRKGSKDNFIEWSDRLYQAYLAAKALHAKHKIASIDAPLILGSHGHQLRKSALDTAMQRLKKLMESEGLGDIFWSLHKLKSKGVSDARDARIAGHKSEAMRERYKTKIERHKPAK